MKVGIHAFASIDSARRGWCAFAHHDEEAAADAFPSDFNAYRAFARHDG
jgi:hypothetical protein